MFERFKEVKVEITDSEFLNTLPLHGVKSYVEENHWEYDDDYVGMETMRFVKHDKAILLPKKEQIDDYGELLVNALKRISDVDGKNQLVIVEEIFHYQENWNHTLNLISFVNRQKEEEEPDEETVEREEKKFDKLKVHYVKELTAAVEEAKEYNERRYNYSGMPKSPLYEYGRVIAVFRKYWLKCQEINNESSHYYNPKWLTHEDLSGELRQIIDEMPFYPVGTEKDGGYC